MDALSRLGLLGSTIAALAAACCVLPLALMLIGLGGSWLAVFGVVAAAGFHVAAVSAAVLAAAWVAAIKRRAARRTYMALGIGSLTTAAAWGVMLNEATINDALISLM